MLSSWWLLWMVLMFFLLVPPLGYGWGYRGWGPPYPRYVQRRRSQQLTASGAARPFKHEHWGRGGDLLWVVFFIDLFWLITAIFWWRWRH